MRVSSCFSFGGFFHRQPVTASPNGGAINELTPTSTLIDRAAARALPGLVLLALAPVLAVPNAARAQTMPLAFSVTEPVRGTFDIDIEGTTSPWRVRPDSEQRSRHPSPVPLHQLTRDHHPLVRRHGDGAPRQVAGIAPDCHDSESTRQYSRNWTARGA